MYKFDCGAKVFQALTNQKAISAKDYRVSVNG
jgi:hypothetical protein